MRQHRVPQEIMSVEFNLFGAMNIRQFGYVAGGGAFGYFMYLIMPGILRFPAAGVCVCFGLALAFLPIDDRPLDQHVSNFLLALKKPTRMVWKKTPRPPAFLIDPIESLKDKKKNVAVYVGKKEKVAGSGVFTSDKRDDGIEEIDEDKSPSISETLDLTNDEEIIIPTDYTPVQYRLKPDEGEVRSETSVETQNLSSSANVITGRVIDEDRKPISTAVVIIKNEKGMPVQAVRVNTKGEFIPKSPLPNGEYEVSASAVGLIIEKKKVQLNGEIQPSINLSVVSKV